MQSNRHPDGYSDTSLSWGSAVDALYDAVGDADALALALGQLRPFFGAQRVSILRCPDLRRPAALQIAACDVPPEMLLEYQTHYVAEDVWIQAAARRQLVRTGAVVRGSALVSRDDLQRSRFWREYLRRYDQSDVLAGVLEAPDLGGNALTFVTFMRGVQPGPFPSEGEERMAFLIPELQRVLRLHEKLAPVMAIGSTLAALYEGLASPMGFVDSGGSVLHSNASADVAISTGSLIRCSPSGSLEQCYGDEWKSIKRLLSALNTDPSVETLVMSRQGLAAMFSLRRAEVAPSDVTGLNLPHASAVFTLRPLQLETDGDHIAMRFDLTPRELEVACGLGAGFSPEQLATRLGRSITTIRTHIASLLDKTASGRQIEMMAKLQGRAQLPPISKA